MIRIMNTERESFKESLPENPLGHAPIPGLILKYAIPSIVAMLISAVYNITDQIFIGHVVGMLGNAATNVAFPLTILSSALAQLIGIGTAANFNINIGAKRPKEAGRYLGTGLLLLSICGPLLSVLVLLFKTPILLLTGATEAVMPLAQIYLGITALGLPFLIFTQAGSNFIRADGSPSYAMVAVSSGALLNVFLDWLFMLVFNWGIQGAAAATVIGQIVSFLLVIAYLPRFKTVKLQFDLFRLKLKYIVSIVKLGTSNFINHLIMMAVNIVMNNTLTRYGALTVYGSEIPLAVSGVVAKLNSILAAFSVGIAQGCQPIHGFNMGAKNYGRLKKTYKTAFAASIIFSILAFLAFQLFPRQIISIFGAGNELYYQFAESYLRIFMLMVFIFGLQPLTVNYFTAIGYAKQGIILSISRQGLFLIPLLVTLPAACGLDGILYAGPIADSLAGILSIALISINFRDLGKLEQLQTNSAA